MLDPHKEKVPYSCPVSPAHLSSAPTFCRHERGNDRMRYGNTHLITLLRENCNHSSMVTTLQAAHTHRLLNQLYIDAY